LGVFLKAIFAFYEVIFLISSGKKHQRFTPMLVVILVDESIQKVD